MLIEWRDKIVTLSGDIISDVCGGAAVEGIETRLNSLMILCNTGAFYPFFLSFIHQRNVMKDILHFIVPQQCLARE